MEILLRVQQCLELLLRHLAAGVPLGSARRAVSGGVVSMMPIMNLYRLAEVTSDVCFHFTTGEKESSPLD